MERFIILETEQNLLVPTYVFCPHVHVSLVLAVLLLVLELLDALFKEVFEVSSPPPARRKGLLHPQDVNVPHGKGVRPGVTTQGTFVKPLREIKSLEKRYTKKNRKK
jgi:hypothetical protein